MTEASLRFAAGQIMGRRERQEDDLGILDLGVGNEDCVLLAIADGMGGHAGGAEAAQCAVKIFLDIVEQNSGAMAERLQHALHGANTAIADLTRANESLNGAGCTLVAAAVEGGTLSWISVGDSSLLLLRDGQITRLNEDHSMRPVLAEMVKAGRLSISDAEKRANRNALRSAVTGDELTLVDQPAAPFPIRPGDQLLLASDGLDVLGYDTVADLLERHAEEPTSNSVDAILKEIENAQIPRQDNATIVLYRVPSNIAAARPKAPHWLFGSRGFLVTVIIAIFVAAAIAVLGARIIAQSKSQQPPSFSSWASRFLTSDPKSGPPPQKTLDPKDAAHSKSLTSSTGGGR